MEPGLIVVIGAVLIFYLRLITMQRRRAKVTQQLHSLESRQKRKSGGTTTKVRPSVLSTNPRDLWIAGIGMLLIIFGALLYAGSLPFSGILAFWWIPISTGIVAFSWGFKP